MPGLEGGTAGAGCVGAVPVAAGAGAACGVFAEGDAERVRAVYNRYHSEVVRMSSSAEALFNANNNLASILADHLGDLSRARNCLEAALTIRADDRVTLLKLTDIQARLGDGSVLSHGELRLQPARRAAVWKGALVPLTNREFWLLETLVRKKGQIVSRERLEEALYGWGDEIDSNTVEVYIHHLRRKLGPGLIKTVRGLGYKLEG